MTYIKHEIIYYNMSVKSRMIFALIPSRGGSKGELGKNMRIVHGKPLI